MCRSDTFLSVQSGCEGNQTVAVTGSVWTSPPLGFNARQLLRCKATSTGELFESLDPGCEGQTVDRALGYVIDTV